MFNILSHDGNANQNNTEIPPHPSQDDSHQENKQQWMLARMVEWGVAVEIKEHLNTVGGNIN
jgi:hypothetical protein